MKYSDRSHNTMEDYISKTVVIDTVKPVVKVDYANHDLKNQLSDREGHDREYYDEVQTATITVTEEHFAANEVKFDITAKDASGSALDTDSLIEKTEWTSKGDQHTITITYPGDANYSFDIAYADLATNQADNYQEDYFTVDKTKPTDISISYSTSILDTVLSGISFGFYQAPVTVTVKGTDRISGIHNFRYSYLKAEGVSGVNAELKNQVIEEDAIEISGDGMTGTAVFKIPHGELGVQNQFHGTVAVRASDRSGNQTEEYNDSKRIVVDNIAPTASITYNAPVNTENGVSYYNEAIQATIMVNEANFYQEDVKVSVASKEGTAYEVSPEWSDSSTDVHVGTFSLTGDGDYFITVNYTDKSSNQMAAYTSGQMTVDTQIVKPTITVNGEDGNGKAYKDEVIPSVVFDDVNFSGYEIHMTRTRYNKKDEDVTDEFIGNNITLNEHGGTGVFDTFVKKPEVDGIYTLSVTQRDKAMHSATESITFTVNRYGSVYVYSDYLSKLIKNGGAYVKELKEDLVVTEYNADKLVSGSLNVNVSHDGKPVQDVSYKTDPEINDKVTVGSSGWYQYRYTVAKKNFAADGVYRMSISSRDATGNQPEMRKTKKYCFTWTVQRRRSTAYPDWTSQS